MRYRGAMVKAICWAMMLLGLSGAARSKGPRELTHQFTGSGFVVETIAGEPSRVYVGSHATILCIDALTGRIIWTHRTPYGTVDVGPILANGTVVYGGGGGHFTIYGLDRMTGRQKWRKEQRASLIVAGEGLIFANTQFGPGISAIDAGTGRTKWAFHEAGSGSQDRLLYANGVVCTTTFALDGATGQLLWRFKSPVRAMTANGGGKVLLVDEDLSLTTIKPFETRRIRTDERLVPAGAAADGDSLAVVLYKGYPDSATIGIIEVFTHAGQTKLWEKRLTAESGALLRNPIAVGGGRVYVLLPGPDGRTILQALSMESGEELWKRVDPEGLIGPVAVVGNEILANDDVGHLYVIDTKSGNLLKTLAY